MSTWSKMNCSFLSESRDRRYGTRDTRYGLRDRGWGTRTQVVFFVDYVWDVGPVSRNTATRNLDTRNLDTRNLDTRNLDTRG